MKKHCNCKKKIIMGQKAALFACLFFPHQALKCKGLNSWVRYLIYLKISGEVTVNSSNPTSPSPNITLENQTLEKVICLCLIGAWPNMFHYRRVAMAIQQGFGQLWWAPSYCCCWCSLIVSYTWSAIEGNTWQYTLLDDLYCRLLYSHVSSWFTWPHITHILPPVFIINTSIDCKP